MFRAIPLSWRGFGGLYGHCKRTHVESGIVPPTSAQVGARLHLGRLRTLERELHLGLLGLLLRCEQRQNCQGYLPKQKILHHHMCSKCNCHAQGRTLVLDHKRSSSTTKWRVGRGGSCCYVSVCTRNFTLHINSFRSTPLFIPDCPE